MRFAAWSADRNPLHVDPEFARQTHFGRQVVHGVLTVLEALRSLPPGAAPKSLDIEFRNAIFIGDACEARATRDGDVTEIVMHAGDQMVLAIRADVADGATPADLTASDLALAAGHPPRTAPAVRTLGELEAGVEVHGRYPMEPAPGGPPPAIGATAARVLGLCSYVVGMELPGLRSLFTRITLDYHSEAPDSAALVYSARTTRFDPRFRILDTELRVAREDGGLVASGRLRSYVPFSPAQAELSELSARLAPSTSMLAGKVALVVGATRGLGADVASALAVAGCHVYASGRHDDEARRAAHQRLIDTGHDIEFLEGDAASAEATSAPRPRVAPTTSATLPANIEVDGARRDASSDSSACAGLNGT